MCRRRVLHRRKAKTAIAAHFFKRIQQILDTEGVEYDNKVLVELINKHFLTGVVFLMSVSDIRLGVIDAGILAHFSDVKVNDLVKKLKEKTFLRYASGSFLIWITILLYSFAASMMLYMMPSATLAFLLLCLCLLSISIRLPSSRTKK